MPTRTGSVIAGFADRMRRDISLGILSPGQRLVVDQLKREHSLSHPSIREALALLVGEGYVSFEEQKGFQVLGGSIEELSDATRVRAVLECTAVEWSIDRANTDWRAAVNAAHFALAEVEREMQSDPHSFAIEWDERNRSFHLALAQNCGSPHLLDLIGRQYDLTRRYRLMAYADGKSDEDRANWLRKSSDEHKQISDAALAGDKARTSHILGAHVTKGTENEFVLHSFDDARPRKRG